VSRPRELKHVVLDSIVRNLWSLPNCRRKLGELSTDLEGLNSFRSYILLICNNARQFATILGDADLSKTADDFQAKLELLSNKTLREVESWKFVARR